jgi:hypothetical protein
MGGHRVVDAGEQFLLIQAEKPGEDFSGHSGVPDLQRIDEDGIDRQAHSQALFVAIENGPARWLYSYQVIVPGEALEFVVPDNLQPDKAEEEERGQHEYKSRKVADPGPR